MFCETWLNNNFSLHHKDYVTYRLDRGGSTIGGGVAICIRRGINHTLLPHLPLEVIESLGIKVQTNTGEIELHSVYYTLVHHTLNLILKNSGKILRR